MKLGNTAVLAILAGAYGVFGTSAMAQVGEIPDRYDAYTHGHNFMWGSSQWGGFGMILGPIFMLLILVGVVAGVMYFLRLFDGSASGNGGTAGHDRAMAVLKERYAKGEIDSVEFSERKKMLVD